MAFLKCVTLLCVIISVQGFTIKSPRILLPPEGLTLEVVISPQNKSGSMINTQVKENNVEVDDLPELEERSGGIIGAGNCPKFYVRIGKRCIKDEDGEE